MQKTWNEYFRYAVENFFDGDYDASYASLKEATKLCNHQFGPGHEASASCAVLAACIELMEGDYRRSSASFRNARQQADLLVNEEHRTPLFIACLTGITLSEYLLENSDETATFARSTLKNLQLQSTMPRYLRDQYLQGFYEFCLSENDRDSALAFAFAHVELLEKEADQYPEAYGESLARLAILEYFNDQEEQAIKHLERCAGILATTQVAGKDMIAGIHTLATICLERNELESARGYLETGHEYAEVEYDRHSPTLNDIKIFLANFLNRNGNPHRAEELYEQILPQMDTRAFPSEAIFVLEEMIALLSDQERDQAMRIHQKRLDMVKLEVHGPGATLEERKQFTEQVATTRKLFTGTMHPVVGMYLSLHSKTTIIQALGSTVSRVIEKL